MPSTRHELPLLLLRERPALLATLIEAAFGIRIGDELIEAGASFVDIDAAAYAADLVLVSARGVTVVEAQTTCDAMKRYRWPLYAASAHATHQRPTWLVVIALDETVARWARQPIASFHGGSMTPLVIGPDQIPRVHDVEQALAMPELAILSALAHGRGEEGAPIAAAALAASAVVERRDEDRGKLFFDAVLASLDDVARAALEAMMRAQGYEYQSEFARKYVAQGREEGREEGLRVAVRQVCAGMGIDWSDARARQVAGMDAAALETLCATLSRDRRWPA